MAIYNSKMFSASKASVFPIKQKSRPKKRNRLQEKLEREWPLEHECLQKQDVESLQEETNLVSYKKMSWLQSAFCCASICASDRKLRLQRKTEAYIEKQLDIRNLIKTRIDTSVLTRLLLNKQQLHLFQNQHARSLVQYSQSSDLSDSAYDFRTKDKYEKHLFVPSIVSQKTISSGKQQDEV